MQRSPALRPLSRQHHLGLKASQVKDDISHDEMMSQWQMLSAYMHDELTAHFAVEEDYLIHPLITEHSDNPTVKAVGDALLKQHQTLKALLENTHPSIENVRQLGQALYDHIRFEERQVFPLAQELLSSQQLETIYQHAEPTVKY